MTNHLAMPSPAARAGQTTMIEQARAMAEVHAQMTIARDNPRSEQLARTRMNDACARMALAEKAFYRYSRGGSQISGPSVHLARELARCWGNITYGVKEMSRRDDLGQSEMMADAWDIETNARSVISFIVPHRRDTKKGAVDLVDMRDIYENNANAGARRLREAIFAVLPVWFREEAITKALETLEVGDGKPLVQRKADLLQVFADEHRVSQRQIEQKLGRPEGQWTAGDIATMTVVYKSLKAGETTVDLEFPLEQGHVGQLITPAAVPDPPAGAEIGHALISSDRLAAIHALMSQLQTKDCTIESDDIATLIGDEHATDPAKLSNAEADQFINILERLATEDQPAHALDALIDAIQNPEKGPDGD